MTEGILIREIMGDPLLKTYSAIMLDEVHERSLYTDIIMGLLKKILKVSLVYCLNINSKFYNLQKRRDLRLIIASATMDAKEIQTFFNSNNTGDKKKDTSVILSVHGRQFPVDVHYLKGTQITF